MTPTQILASILYVAHKNWAAKTGFGTDIKAMRTLRYMAGVWLYAV